MPSLVKIVDLVIFNAIPVASLIKMNKYCRALMLFDAYNTKGYKRASKNEDLFASRRTGVSIFIPASYCLNSFYKTVRDTGMIL